MHETVNEIIKNIQFWDLEHYLIAVVICFQLFIFLMFISVVILGTLPVLMLVLAVT